MRRVAKLIPRKHLIIIGMAVLVLAWSIWQLNGPAVGTITKGKATPRAARPAAKAAPLQSKYLQVQVSDDYKAQSLTSKDLESFKLQSQGGPPRMLVISVVQPPFGPQDMSSYLYRQQHPELYTKQQAGEATVFTGKEGSYEKTAFIFQGNLVATMALTSYQGDTSSLDEEFERLLKTFTWK